MITSSSSHPLTFVIINIYPIINIGPPSPHYQHAMHLGKYQGPPDDN